MASAIFDTLQYAKKAEEVGFTRKQAEFQAEEMAKILDENLVTKRDLREAKKDIIISIGAMITAAVVLLPIVFKLISII